MLYISQYVNVGKWQVVYLAINVVGATWPRQWVLTSCIYCNKCANMEPQVQSAHSETAGWTSGSWYGPAVTIMTRCTHEEMVIGSGKTWNHHIAATSYGNMLYMDDGQTSCGYRLVHIRCRGTRDAMMSTYLYICGRFPL